MGRMYYATFDCTTVTTAQDLFEIVPATDDPILVWAFEVTNATEVGDAQEEMLELNLIRRTGTPTSGSGGAAVTEVSAVQDDVATTAAVEENNTTAATAGTAQTLLKVAWNVRIPYLWTAPHERAAVQVKDNDLIHLNLVTAPADTMDILGWVLYEEL